jgi:phospholipid transport system substrate-binding protein
VKSIALIRLSRRVVLALALGQARGAYAADTAAIQAPIRALNDALLTSMKAGKSTPFAQRADALAPVVRAAFNLPVILQVSVGPGWAQLPQPQQIDLLRAFETFTIATYAANFESYGGERFELLPDLRSAGADQIVQTRLVPASGTPIALDYVMRQSGDRWQAVDVLLDGTISRVAVQRSDFRSLLHPADASALIDSLQRKVKQLSTGTL